MKGIRRIICALLALLFLFGLVPMDASVAAAEAGQLGEAIIEGNRDFKWPVPDYHNISACFFDDRDHYAIDIGTMTTNADIVASYDGEVAEITRNGANDYGYGNAVMLRHTYTTSSGTITLYSRYAHMSEISESLSVGSAVVGGETVLGKTGGSGYGSANYYAVHLDFQILTSNDWLNRQTCSIDPFANNLMELPADLYLGRTSDCCQSYIDAIKALYAGDAHTHSYESAVTPPTCTEDGYTTYTCSCGDSYTDDEVTAPGHSYGADGVCTVCGDVEALGRVTFSDGVSLSWGELQKKENGEKYGYDASAITDDTIGASAFYDCQKIVGIFIHKGVIVVGDNAFNNCSNLNHVLFAGTEAEWSAISIGGGNDRLELTENHFEAEPEDFYSHINCVCVAHYCSACGFFELRNISGAAHNFVDGECTECDAISEFEYTFTSEGVYISGYNGTGPNMIIPASIEGIPVRTISPRSFSYQDKITSVTIPYGVTKIGGSAFHGLKNLTSINIPDSVTKIGHGAFIGCSSLTSIEIPDSVTSIEGSAFEGCDGFKSVLIPSSVKEMGQCIFAGCDSLESVTFADGATIVGSRMFEDCSSLESVYLPDSLKQIRSGAFRHCVNLTNIELPDSLETIGSNAFIGCSKITSVYIGKNLESIGNSAFSGCTGITEIHIADLAAWCSIEFAELSSNPMTSAKEQKAFVNGKILTELVIPEGVTSVGDYAFCFFRDLTSVVIPNTVTTIGREAFYECRNISNTIVIPESVTRIGGDAFGGCRNITDIVILGNLSTIEIGAFSGCERLERITLPDSINTIRYSAFNFSGSINEVFYAGTKEQRSAIKVEQYNPGLDTATWHYEVEDSATHWQTTTTATCTTAGYTNKYCACGYTQNNVWEPALGHSWAVVNCSTPKTCSLCGATDGEAPGHDMGEWVTTEEPTCTTDGSKRKDCSRCDHFETEVIPAGHDMGDWYTVTEATPELDGEERRDCSRCDHFESRVTRFVDNMLKLEGEDFLDETTVYINGLPYPVVVSGDERYVELPTEEDCSIVTYDFHVGDPDDIHTQYPVGMKVYIVSDGEITYVEELDNLLQYSGSSIRITGKKGIRMITSLYKNTKSALAGKGLAGYKLVEYGTVLAFAHEVEGDGDLVLGKDYSRSNYAYKRGVSDPVYANKGDLTQYTNVLVGFNLDQCKEDLAMRPYIILENAEGEQFTIYGGTIYRSIGYVAYQNRNAVKPGTAAYNFVWEIIHHVYGDKYDSDYKG